MSGPGEAWSHRNAPGWLAGKVRWTFQPVAPALAWIAVIGLSAFLHVPSAAAQAPAGPAAADTRIVFPASVQQGAMVIGKVPPGSQVEYAGRTLRSTGYGTADVALALVTAAGRGCRRAGSGGVAGRLGDLGDDRRMGDIAGLAALEPVEVGLPLRVHAVGGDQVLFVQVLDVGGIAAELRRLRKLLD